MRRPIQVFLSKCHISNISETPRPHTLIKAMSFPKKINNKKQNKKTFQLTKHMCTQKGKESIIKKNLSVYDKPIIIFQLYFVCPSELWGSIWWIYLFDAMRWRKIQFPFCFGSYSIFVVSIYSAGYLFILEYLF